MSHPYPKRIIHSCRGLIFNTHAANRLYSSSHSAESSSLATFRRKHSKHSTSKQNPYYERKLRLKEKVNERKQYALSKRKEGIKSEASQLLNNLYSASSPPPQHDSPSTSDAPLSRSQIAERKKKLHRYNESMKRKSNTQYTLRHPDAHTNTEIPMPKTMHEKFVAEFIENGVKKWVSPTERKAKFAETIALLKSKDLTAHRAIRIFDKKIKKYSLHLPLPDYLNLLVPLVRGGYVEKTFEIYSRMKHFDNLQITPHVIATVMRSLSEANPENERVVAISDENLLVLKAKHAPSADENNRTTNQSSPNDSPTQPLPSTSQDAFAHDPDLNPLATKAKKTHSDVDHVACVARAHDLLNKDCLQYNIPLQTSILTEFIRVLGKHGLPKKAFTIFHKMLSNTKLHNLSQQAYTDDTTMELTEENVNMLSSLVHELGEEAEEEVVEALSKAKGTTKGDATKKRMVVIEGQPQLIPDKYTYGVVIEALAHNGEIAKVLKLFEEIPRVYKRIPVYNALFAALSKCRDQFESKMLAEEGRVPDFSKTVLQYYQELMKLRLHPTKHTFSLILQCVPERCYDVLREMRVQRVEPDKLLEGQLLNEMIEHGYWKETAKELLPNIPVGSIPKGVMYQLFQKIIVSRDLTDVEDVEPFLKFMQQSGMQDLKLDPKLRLFLQQKKKTRLLRGLEEYIQRSFREKYDPTKIAAHHEERRAQQNLDQYRDALEDEDNELDEFGFEVSNADEARPAAAPRRGGARTFASHKKDGEDSPEKAKKNVLRMSTSSVLSSLQASRKKTRAHEQV